ncbi:FecCD family ABC transporter permease [Effusibacillus pohliae]|uniref:FecCD family ABC transporter permease n=1 Tax=Effusibacillus pohliae TaxID=232270 RepID=UPI000378710D|nr:iron ABC transporter permease [Effusibacillus pohliae]
MKKYVSFRINRPPVSMLLDKKAVWVTLALLIVTLLALIISTGIGTLTIHPLDVVKALLGIGSEQDRMIIHTFRLPRSLAAMLVGAALAAAGAILQAVFRNPLASPDIIGITGGASVAAVAYITLFETASIRWLPFVAFLGAALIALLIYGLAWKNGVTPLRLVLIGVGLDFAMHALTTLLLVSGRIHLTSKAKIWLTGSVYGTAWHDVGTLFLWTLVLIPLAFVCGRNGNVQQLGDELATGVGSALQRQRFFLLLISVGLAGAAIAIGGAIAFVGLLAPHIARKWVGSTFGALLPVAALVGGLTVLLADLVARTAFSPVDLPVGIFTSAIGAPFFIYLLYRNRHQ